jgi:hypothetical protein
MGVDGLGDLDRGSGSVREAVGDAEPRRHTDRL